ncbi:MAG TPA: hypothetical protein VMU33_03020 [Burkholderiaceae bacterium]|nr:hypothetical protein [Burkholderiaceae bacterium]
METLSTHGNMLDDIDTPCTDANRIDDKARATATRLVELTIEEMECVGGGGVIFRF